MAPFGWVLLALAAVYVRAQVQLPVTGRVVAQVLSRDPWDVTEGLQVAYLVGRGTGLTANILKCDLSSITPYCDATLPLANNARVGDLGGGYASFPYLQGGTSSYGLFAQLQGTSELQVVTVELDFAGGPSANMTQTRLTVIDSNGGMPNAHARNVARETVSYLGTTLGKVYAISYPASSSVAPGFSSSPWNPGSNAVLGMAFLPSTTIGATPGDGTLFASLYPDTNIYSVPLSGGGTTFGPTGVFSFSTSGLLGAFAPINRLFLTNSQSGYELTGSGTVAGTWSLTSGSGSDSCLAITPSVQEFAEPIVFSGISPSGSLLMVAQNFTTDTGPRSTAPNSAGLVCSSAFIAKVSATDPAQIFFTGISSSSPSTSQPVQYAVDLFTLTNCTSNGCSSPTPTRTPSITKTTSRTPSPVTPSRSASVSPAGTPSVSSSVSPSATSSSSVSPSPTSSSSVTPAATSSSSVTPAATLSSSVTASVQASSSVQPTPSVSPSVSASVAASPSFSPSVSPTASRSVFIPPIFFSLSATITATPSYNGSALPPPPNPDPGGLPPGGKITVGIVVPFSFFFLFFLLLLILGFFNWQRKKQKLVDLRRISLKRVRAAERGLLAQATGVLTSTPLMLDMLANVLLGDATTATAAATMAQATSNRNGGDKKEEASEMGSDSDALFPSAAEAGAMKTDAERKIWGKATTTSSAASSLRAIEGVQLGEAEGEQEMTTLSSTAWVTRAQRGSVLASGQAVTRTNYSPFQGAVAATRSPPASPGRKGLAPLQREASEEAIRLARLGTPQGRLAARAKELTPAVVAVMLKARSFQYSDRGDDDDELEEYQQGSKGGLADISEREDEGESGADDDEDNEENGGGAALARKTKAVGQRQPSGIPSTTHRPAVATGSAHALNHTSPQDSAPTNSTDSSNGSNWSVSASGSRRPPGGGSPDYGPTHTNNSPMGDGPVVLPTPPASSRPVVPGLPSANTTSSSPSNSTVYSAAMGIRSPDITTPALLATSAPGGSGPQHPLRAKSVAVAQRQFAATTGALMEDLNPKALARIVEAAIVTVGEALTDSDAAKRMMVNAGFPAAAAAAATGQIQPAGAAKQGGSSSASLPSHLLQAIIQSAVALLEEEMKRDGAQLPPGGPQAAGSPGARERAQGRLSFTSSAVGSRGSFVSPLHNAVELPTAHKSINDTTAANQGSPVSDFFPSSSAFTSGDLAALWRYEDDCKEAVSAWYRAHNAVDMASETLNLSKRSSRLLPQHVVRLSFSEDTPQDLRAAHLEDALADDNDGNSSIAGSAIAIGEGDHRHQVASSRQPQQRQQGGSSAVSFFNGNNNNGGLGVPGSVSRVASAGGGLRVQSVDGRSVNNQLHQHHSAAAAVARPFSNQSGLPRHALEALVISSLEASAKTAVVKIFDSLTDFDGQTAMLALRAQEVLQRAAVEAAADKEGLGLDAVGGSDGGAFSSIASFINKDGSVDVPLLGEEATPLTTDKGDKKSLFAEKSATTANSGNTLRTDVFVSLLGEMDMRSLDVLDETKGVIPYYQPGNTRKEVRKGRTTALEDKEEESVEKAAETAAASGGTFKKAMRWMKLALGCGAFGSRPEYKSGPASGVTHPSHLEEAPLLHHTSSDKAVDAVTQLAKARLYSASLPAIPHVYSRHQGTPSKGNNHASTSSANSAASHYFELEVGKALGIPLDVLERLELISPSLAAAAAANGGDAPRKGAFSLPTWLSGASKDGKTGAKGPASPGRRYSQSSAALAGAADSKEGATSGSTGADKQLRFDRSNPLHVKRRLKTPLGKEKEVIYTTKRMQGGTVNSTQSPAGGGGPVADAKYGASEGGEESVAVVVQRLHRTSRRGSALGSVTPSLPSITERRTQYGSDNPALLSPEMAARTNAVSVLKATVSASSSSAAGGFAATSLIDVVASGAEPLAGTRLLFDRLAVKAAKRRLTVMEEEQEVLASSGDARKATFRPMRSRWPLPPVPLRLTPSSLSSARRTATAKASQLYDGFGSDPQTASFLLSLPRAYTAVTGVESTAGSPVAASASSVALIEAAARGTIGSSTGSAAAPRAAASVAVAASSNASVPLDSPLLDVGTPRMPPAIRRGMVARENASAALQLNTYNNNANAAVVTGQGQRRGRYVDSSGGHMATGPQGNLSSNDAAASSLRTRSRPSLGNKKIPLPVPRGSPGGSSRAVNTPSSASSSRGGPPIAPSPAGVAYSYPMRSAPSAAGFVTAVGSPSSMGLGPGSAVRQPQQGIASMGTSGGGSRRMLPVGTAAAATTPGGSLRSPGGQQRNNLPPLAGPSSYPSSTGFRR